MNHPCAVFLVQRVSTDAIIRATGQRRNQSEIAPRQADVVMSVPLARSAIPRLGDQGTNHESAIDDSVYGGTGIDLSFLTQPKPDSE